jgi:uncharacterized protein (TIGR00296 family)
MSLLQITLNKRAAKNPWIRMGQYSIEEGRVLTEAARSAIELYLTSPRFSAKMITVQLRQFEREHGVFVTIEHYPTRTVRGCIGFARGIRPLPELLVQSAIAAASEDPRFVPVSHLEFEHMIVEVDILSKPVRLSGTADKIRKAIKPERDGLIIEYGYRSGTMLPSAAADNGWAAEEFLENLCASAGLERHTWHNAGAKLYRFTVEAFRESSPRGKVEKVA